MGMVRAVTSGTAGGATTMTPRSPGSCRPPDREEPCQNDDERNDEQDMNDASHGTGRHQP
jgi:hypothetical protein